MKEQAKSGHRSYKDAVWYASNTEKKIKSGTVDTKKAPQEAGKDPGKTPGGKGTDTSDYMHCLQQPALAEWHMVTGEKRNNVKDKDYKNSIQRRQVKLIKLQKY